MPTDLGTAKAAALPADKATIRLQLIEKKQALNNQIRVHAASKISAPIPNDNPHAWMGGGLKFDSVARYPGLIEALRWDENGNATFKLNDGKTLPPKIAMLCAQVAEIQRQIDGLTAPVANDRKFSERENANGHQKKSAAADHPSTPSKAGREKEAYRLLVEEHSKKPIEILRIAFSGVKGKLRGKHLKGLQVARQNMLAAQKRKQNQS